MRFIDEFTPTSEEKKLLADHLFQENIQRSKLFATIVILFESILIVMNVASSYKSNGYVVLNVYLFMYLLLLGMSGFMVMYVRRFEQNPRPTEKEYDRFQVGLFLLVVFFLTWGSVVTLFDQKTYGHVMAFAINFMCVSILFHASNRTILYLYIFPVSVLLIGLPFFQASNEVIFGHYVNLSVFLFFCWLASRMLYKSYSANFYHQLLLMKTNEKLAFKITENEKMNAKLTSVNEQLKKLTFIDELTGIRNRRGFHEGVSQEIQLNPGPSNVSIFMIDIDAFKQFNDCYGHLAGDDVIKRVAKTMRIQVQHPTSILARFGGEEFVVAMFHLSEQEAYELAERIREEICRLKITHTQSTVAPYVTISIGIAIGQVTTKFDVEKLIGRADQALYRAKEKGRNRVEIDKEMVRRFVSKEEFVTL
ncbi:GGDEF domain-containing protein [Bacillus sp. CGMCC 1.16541]|uniref:GGDEF domain-containing protein n=1 Tax=Bacillus sp. CGMCC 1.16541 TaxID=2185143 RepID=UPI0013A53569|nr:GGDEF domain-containing protein [Bacillus sp. CGMCC 1.16541]